MLQDDKNGPEAVLPGNFLAFTFADRKPVSPRVAEA